jgi:hypothetical protein
VEIMGEVTVTHGVFGGGRNASLTLTPTVSVLPQAVLFGDIYGGGMGRVSPALSKTMNGKWEAFCARFRTSRSYLVADLADAAVPSTSVIVDGTVHGSVYGGGLLATVGDAKRTTWDQTVTVVRLEENARVDGSVYGGGRGQEETDYAVIFGSTSVLLNGGAGGNGAVFGSGQIAPVAGSTLVVVNGGEFDSIYGGGRDGAYDGSGTGVVVAGGTVKEAYAGGMGAAAVTETASITISGGEVGSAYAGGNGAETTDTSITITGGRVGTAYAGGNTASITGSTALTVLTTDRAYDQTVQHVDTVFAGNNEAPMDIQPTLDLVSGRIGTVYCGGNGGIMTAADSDDIWYLTYEFDAPDIEIENLFAGCRHTSDNENTSNVTLNLVSGTYGIVYGGNDGSGYMNNTNIVIDPSVDPDRELGIGTVYGGGRMAACPKTQVTIYAYENAQYPLTVYGGGNRATVTKEITIRAGIGKKGTAHIENLYCGNNAAGLSIVPRITTDDVDIVNLFD